MSEVVESIEIPVPPEQVYDLVSDVSRMGEWSPESTGARGASRTLHVGETFWGINKRGLWRWATKCTVTSADRGVRFAFDVDFGPLPVSAWAYDFVPTADGCRVVESWTDRRVGTRGKVMKTLGSVVIPGPREDHNRATMRATLKALKRAATAT